MAQAPKRNLYSIVIKVDNFRDSKGVAQFALYNRDGTIPDEKLKKYYKKEVGEIKGGKSCVTFENIPGGRYAVTVLHDENSNGEIDKIFFYPKEGFGISNFRKYLFQIVLTSQKPVLNWPKMPKRKLSLFTNETSMKINFLTQEDVYMDVTPDSYLRFTLIPFLNKSCKIENLSAIQR